MTLVLLGGFGTAFADDPKMYILGSNSELGNWKPDAAKEMTYAEDGTYYFTFTANSSADYYFCFSGAVGTNADDWTTFNNSCYRPSIDYTLNFGRPYIVGDNSATTFVKTGDKSLKITLVKDTEYLIGFDPTNSRVVVTYKPTSINVLGGASGWHTNSGTEMTNVGDYVYSCYFTVNETNTFAFTTKLSASDDDWDGIKNYRFGAYKSSGNYVISSFPATGINMEWGNDNNHSYKIETEGTYKLVLDYKLMKLEVYNTQEISTAKDYTTYVSTDQLDFSTASDLTAYIATSADNANVTLKPVTKVPANTPLVLKRANETASHNVAFFSSDPDDVSGNKLRAGDGTTTIGGESNFDYVLKDGTFFRATEGTVAKGKAYLHLDSDPGATPGKLSIIFEDSSETDGIKSVENGKFAVESVYNLAGQKVGANYKGIVIVNGKKVVRK